ncbi:MAG: hypothetical protein OHK0053_37920 [Microscillaceae bacterium]
MCLGGLWLGATLKAQSPAPRDVAWAVAIRSADGYWGVALASTLPRSKRFSLTLSEKTGLSLQLTEVDADSLFRLSIQWGAQKPAVIEKGEGWQYQPGLTEAAFGENWGYVVKNLPHRAALDTLVKHLSSPSPFRIGTQLCEALQSVVQFVNPLSAQMRLYREGQEAPIWEGQVDFDSEPIAALRNWYAYEQLQKQLQNAPNLKPGEWESLCNDLTAFPGLYAAGLEAALRRNESQTALHFLLLARQEKKAPPLPIFDYFVLNGEAAYQALLPASLTTTDWLAALQSLLRWQKPDEMLFWWKKALLQSPDSAYLYWLAGEAYRQKNSLNLAKKHYRRALQLDPNLTEAQRALQLR